MCGRYSLDARPEEVAEAFSLLERVAFEPRYNIAPTQNAPVVRLDRETGARRLELLRWGLTPSWWKGDRPLINARGETVATRSAFRKAFERRRCLVPATGFFEWQKLGGSRQPFNIQVREGGLFAFAGIWDRTRDDEGNAVDSYAILTTDPNTMLKPIHDRMPVILDPRVYGLWLDPEPESLETLQDLIAPAPVETMRAYPVSRLVNSTANDEPACVQPAAGRSEGQGEFDW
jgi:putative SOS response-associated peptidase YedK